MKSEQEPFWWAKSAFGTSSFDGIWYLYCFVHMHQFLALKIQRKEKDKISLKPSKALDLDIIIFYGFFAGPIFEVICCSVAG